MAINIPDGFGVGAGVPIDSRMQVASQAARDAIPEVVRWEGMQVYSIGDATTYKLVGGLTDAFWVEDKGGGGVSPWVTATDYEIGDVVTAINGIYTCNAVHTSGATFLDDLSNWDATVTSNVTIQNVIADRTIEVTDDVLLVDCGSFGADITLTLPPASTYQKILTIKRIDSQEQYTINIVRSGSDLIDGQTSFPIYRQYDSIRLVGTSTIWSII